MKLRVLLLLAFLPVLSFAQDLMKASVKDIKGGASDYYMYGMYSQDKSKSIRYKTAPDAPWQEMHVSNISEVTYENGQVFRAFDIEIEKSLNRFEEMQVDPEPRFVKERALLQLLVGTTYELYEYDNKYVQKYFARSTDSLQSPPQQLISIKYRKGQEVYENRQFSLKLLGLFKDDQNAYKKYKDIRYNRKALISLFMEKNGKQAINFTKKHGTSTDRQYKYSLSVFLGARRMANGIPPNPIPINSRVEIIM